MEDRDRRMEDRDRHMSWMSVSTQNKALYSIARADLPDGCTPLNDIPFATFDPSAIYEANDELGDILPPSRIGDWREDFAIPTQHFAINQIKPGSSPLRIMPYSSVLTSEGITYDAYTLERWWEPGRSDEMLQQTPGRQGEPWEKLIQVGTNMKQLVSGPDGHPTGTFSGRSGVQVGIQNSGDPTWTEFGDMYAHFLFENTLGGSMEVPLVRGSPMLTHLFSNANPLLIPHCLSAVNGQEVTGVACPTEGDAIDGGDGFIDGSCSGGTLHITLRTTKPVPIESVQWAANTLPDWEAGDHPMITCGSECQMSDDGRTIDVTVPGATGTMAFAMNVIGRYIVPQNWIDEPALATCSGHYLPPSGSLSMHSGETNEENHQQIVPVPMPDPVFCAELPDISDCSDNFCKHTFCQEDAEGQDFKLIIQLDEPIEGIHMVQIAINTFDEWENSHPMIDCSPETCTLLADQMTLIYCARMPAEPIKYAVNVVGRFVQPPGDWTTEPFQFQCGDGGADIGIDSRFVLELDEPMGNLPEQTRKYVVYFRQDMRAVLNANGLSFQLPEGGEFSGMMQLVYAGASPRGDLSVADYFDQYAGVYSLRPKTSYCAQDGKGYISFDWNKANEDGPTDQGNLLMITMPHQEVLLEAQGNLVETPFTFKGFVGDSWLLEEDLPTSSMDPDPEAVARIQENPQQLADILAGLDRDAEGQRLEESCITGNSYWVGKDIAMVARLASISRAFQTSHYVEMDGLLEACLEKWLRVDDVLDDGNKFRYDTVYGGLLLRSVPEGEPIDPNANFGFPAYSDHHFHLGYWVLALGYYARYHTDWAQTHLDRITLIARDVGNPSFEDKYFPIVRHKDFYLGISWATGLVGGSRQAESSSEAIACYHGLAALGLALNDVTMEQVGQLMLATEIRSVRHYYHVRDYNRHLFPPYIQEYGAIGQFAEDAIFYYTLNWPCDPNWFPMRHACLVGIQVIPIMSISNLFMDQEWAGAVMQVCRWSVNPWDAPDIDMADPDLIEPVATGWGAFCHAVTSQYDEAAMEEAADYVRGLGPQGLVSGTGEASTLLFIYGST